MKRTLIAAILLLILCASLGTNVSASGFVPYNGYEYNSREESVPAPAGYVPEKMVTGQDMTAGTLKTPSDFCFAEGLLYILDSGNGRIIVTDGDLKLVRIIAGFQKDGQTISFTGAGGIYVPGDGTILVADTENSRILKADLNGNLLLTMERPDTKLIDKNLAFKVRKVIRDQNGVIYTLVDGINSGAVTYLPDGSFGGFFASNDVSKTAEAIFNYFWRRFMTEKQIRNSKSSTPASFTSFDLNRKGFLYTVTQSAKGQNSIRLINFKGSNIEQDGDYGDLEWDRKVKDSKSTTFVDVDMDDNEFIYLLDSSRCRVFEYYKDGSLVSIFGSQGTSLGELNSPVAVESQNGKVYVLDSVWGSVTIYAPTEYVKTVKKAHMLLEAGSYGEARQYWEQVLRLNSNSEAAYYGIGMALNENQQYSKALHYFKLSYSNKAYSDAFREVRKDYVKANFLWILFGLVLLIAAVLLLGLFLKKKFGRKNEYEVSALERKYSAPFFTAIHPLDGFESLKEKKGWSIGLSGGMLVLLFLFLSASWFYTGFSFNHNRTSDFNVFITLIQAFGVVFVWVISNWAVTTLIEGKGKLVDIFCTTVYALLPFILSLGVSLLLSNVLTLEEEVFLVFLKQAGILWSLILLICGYMRIHLFSLKKTLLSMLLTVAGIAVIVFLGIMFVGLMKQVISFIQSIASELQMIS